MENDKLKKLLSKYGQGFQAHPWHGIDIGEDCPHTVRAFIEVVPTDTVKYEVDKDSGFLIVDRPQKFSNIVPALYGFIPKTYCDEQVAQFCMDKTERKGIIGDHDPLDICVLTERPIAHGGLLVNAIPIGGLRMIDKGEADDKIIAVLKGDDVYEQWKDVDQIPKAVIDRLLHYFLTYKQLPDESPIVDIPHVYGREEAHEVIKRSQHDYWEKFLKKTK